MSKIPAQQTSADEGSFTLSQVEELRVDALYGKKKHYNAADRKHGYHIRTGIPATIINLSLSSYLAGAAASVFPVFMNWFGALLAAVASVLIALQTGLNFARLSEQHRSIATRYLAITKECGRLIAYERDGKVTAEELRSQLEGLANRLHQINADAERYPTNAADYRKAQQGFAKGEEQYNIEEVSAIG